MRFESFAIVWERLAGWRGWAAESHMYVWYVSKHRHNNKVGVFVSVWELLGLSGSVWGAFGSVCERLGTFRSVLTRCGTFECV